MTVKLDLPPEMLQRMDALAPLAKRASVVRRLVELGLERAEQRPADLLPRKEKK